MRKIRSVRFRSVTARHLLLAGLTTIGACPTRTSSFLARAAACSDPDWRNALTAMVGAGVTHQLHCPGLARLFDVEKVRLPNPKQEKRLVDTVHPAVVSVLRRARIASHLSLPVLAFDLMAITRGMTDAAGVRGEKNADALQRRVMRAIFGYIDAREAA